MYPSINIAGMTIPSYGLMLIVAAIAMWSMLTILSKIKKGIDYHDILCVYLIGICGAIVGAFLLRPVMKLIEVVIFWENYASIPIGEMVDYLVGEIVFYGGLLGGIIAIIFFCRKFDIKITPLLDLFAPSLALGHSIGRVGCFFAGCCYGIEVSYAHPFSVIYPEASIGAPQGVPLLAIQLIESAFLLAMSAALTVIYLKAKKHGLCATIYLLIYPTGRFILEFFRGDMIRGNYGFFTTSQLISIIVFICGILYFLHINRFFRRRFI